MKRTKLFEYCQIMAALFLLSGTGIFLCSCGDEDKDIENEITPPNSGSGSDNEKPTHPQNDGNEIDIFAEINYDEMVYVEGGTFTMGGTAEQGSDAEDDEYPTHRVTLSSYYIGKYEVTQALWEYVMLYNGKAADGTQLVPIQPYFYDAPDSDCGKGENYPVYYISYDDIVGYFLPRLNKITGKKFRLLTEAEWEYAARGGNKSKGYKYSGSNNIDAVAWYNADRIYEVGRKAPNELGLYDMSGNVAEWCSDWYGSYTEEAQTNPTGPFSGSYRVIRGGSCFYETVVCRVSYRERTQSDDWDDDWGVRLAISVEDDDDNDNENGNENDKPEPPTTNETDIFSTVSYDEMVYVEGGTFTMGGTPEQDPDTNDDEYPTHSVTLSSYYIGKYEVTQGLWKTVMGSIPSYVKDTEDNLPVYFATRSMSLEFIKKLNEQTGRKFRLPTEAEWEYAARGGNKSKGYKYSGNNNIDDVAWNIDNSDISRHKVGCKASNELGLYDIAVM